MQSAAKFGEGLDWVATPKRKVMWVYLNMGSSPVGVYEYIST